ncbi:MAG: 3-keto-5-aminohexanoate cleavage protein [Chloroflexi bacterium]|nr:3-keto-5-aminohexanoate cleavage protein [Chloroflexota bacterium]
MATTDKLIICVSPTGNFHGKEANPNIPLQPDEIAEEVYRSWNEGAAIAHIHARDGNGVPTNDPDVFREIDRRIREKKCPIIIQHSTAPGRQPGVTVDDGPRSIEANPEMASLNMGPSSAVFGGREFIRPWTRGFIEKWARVMGEKNIKPEMEVYNNSQMEEVIILIGKGVLKKPYWMSFVMDMHRTAQESVRFSPKHLMHYLDFLPQDSMFTTLAIGAAELPATTLSTLLGGHLRVGFEDNIYYKRGELAKSNAQLVARAARIGRDLGRDPALPDEAREMLNIPKPGLD